MKSGVSIVLNIVTLFLLFGCSSTKKIEAMRPEPDTAAPLLYDATPSFIDLPVQLKLADIETQTNKYLNGLIYEDKNVKDDDIAMSIWKTGPVQITNEKGRIKTVFPMKATIKYRVGTDKLLIDLSTVREFNLNGKLTLLSEVGLTNWKVSSKTELKSIDWNESPTTTVLGKQVPITYIINPAVKFFREDIEKSLDEAIGKSMDFKSNVLDALEKMCTPFQMNQQFDTWLRLVPIELYTTDAVLQPNAVNLEMGLKCNIESFIGKKPEQSFDRNKIVLKPVAKMPDHISANIMAISTYEDASRVIGSNFAGQEFGSGSNKVKVNSIQLWQKSGKLIIAMDMVGSVTGMVYLSGVPKYDPATKEIYIDGLDYAVDTKSRLIKTANWLASGLIVKKMQALCRYNISGNVDDAKKSIMTYLNNYSPVKGVFVNGNIQSIDFQKVSLTDRAIIALMSVNGKIDVKIDGLD
ncbi:DUF4403 family protein [Flavobacterium silvaticum]|uniref:DUF4403 family protein n=1 Tax=Flavobacterium silvaticum TaxID=1852020 RepID=A0A972FKW4_9FLAO|nr:DUF4403 family protein [Flavobacterium silvaticum]NMH27115.1 DUF4403 family protein [Flavobacterium silvaticum]